MTHVLTTVNGAAPPHINARSSSNANAACAYLPGDIGAFDVHMDTPSYMRTDVGSAYPPMTYAFPRSVTIASWRRAIGNDVIGVHDVTPIFDCSHDDITVPPVVWPTILITF